MAITPEEIFANDSATATLASDPGSGGTTLTLTTGHGARFPTITSGVNQMRLRIDSEIVLVTAHAANADTMTVTRGAESTTGAAHGVGSTVNAVLTAEAMRRHTPAFQRHPRQNSLLAWNLPTDATQISSSSPTTGLLHWTKIPVPENITVTTIWWNVAVGGAAAGTGSGQSFALWSSAGTRLGTTSDQATTNQTAGARSATLTADGGQSLSLVGGPGVFVVAALLIVTQHTTTAVQYRNGSSSLNLGMVASDVFLGFTKGSGQSSMPTATQDFTTGTTAANVYMIGLS